MKGRFSLHIREAVIDDLEQLIKLCSLMHSESTYSKVSLDVNKSTVFLTRMIKRKDALSIVLCIKDQIAGLFVASEEEYFFSNDKIVIDHIFFIEKKYRKKTGAKYIANEYLRWSKLRNVKEVMFSTSTGIEQDKVSSFYNKMGFQQSGVIFKLNKED